MRRPICNLLFWIFVLGLSLPAFATRVKDGGSSRNGIGPDSSCPDSQATPFYAVLNGTLSPDPGCNPTNGDPNIPNPPSTYPNRVVTLTGSGFTVTITPALWDSGPSSGGAKATIFFVSFTGQAGMTLQSLVIGSQLNVATGFGLSNGTYIICDPSFPNALPNCVSDPLLDPNTDPTALEPTAIALADGTMTRWDFSQFAPGSSLTMAVDGFPTEFQNIDAFPHSNTLAVASFASANFLAVVKDSSNHILTAGGLSVPTAPAATNDLFANATVITQSPFIDFIDTSATQPQEVLSGTNAGGQNASQGDPIPQDPAAVSPGTPCSTSWPSGSNRVFRSVWYQLTANASGSVTISTDGSRYDTGIYVFTGTTTSPVTVACNDDGVNASGFIIQSSDVTFNASAGQTYFIMVSEVPPPVGVDGSDNPIADPLANDATLKLTVNAGGVIGSSANPVPHIDAVNPVAKGQGSSIAQLTIHGSGFVSGATVNFNGSNLSPSTLTAGQIVVTGVAAPLNPVTLPLTVTNPNSSPSVGTSNVVLFPISNPTASVTLGRTDLAIGGGFSPIGADFNGDNKIDVGSVSSSGNVVTILIGKGNGTFQPQHQYATGTQPISVVTGDFNGDGHLDLAVANEGGSGGNVSVLLGNGDGSFQNHIEYPAGTTPDGIVTGDFNGDGKLDLAVANFGSSNVSILLGSGTGTFQLPVNYPAGSQPVWVTAGDFNGDGKPDLALAGGNVVSVLIGNGDGTFKPAATFPATSPVWVITGDFNGDGNLDLATANAAANTLSVFVGLGNGTFQPHVDYPTGAYAYSVATADLNADGKLDLVAGTISSGVPVLLGNGDGTFKAAIPYTSGAANGALVVTDLNNDGRLDVVPSISTGITVMLQIPTATLNGMRLVYGTQLVGSSSPVQMMPLTNKGSARLKISKIAATGDFQQTNTCGGGLAPGGKCTISITFTPTLRGTRTGSVTITDNAQPATQTISLTGTGTVVQLSVSSLAYGSVKVGTKSAAKNVTVTNTGTTALSITSIGFGGTNPTDFSQTHTCGASLAAGASCTISVSFKPTATGARAASLNIGDNGGGSPQKVTLTGTGT